MMNSNNVICCYIESSNRMMGLSYNNVDAKVYKENIAFLRIRKVTRRSRR